MPPSKRKNEPVNSKAPSSTKVAAPPAKKSKQTDIVEDVPVDSDSDGSSSIISDDDGLDSDSESDDFDFEKVNSDSEDDEDSENESDDGNVNVDFSFVTPSEPDFHSVKRMLVRFLPGEEDKFNSSGLAESIIGQTAVGINVKVNDDPDVYGFATILPHNKFSTCDWLNQMKTYLMKKAEEHDANAARKLKFLFSSDSNKLGFYLNERVVNMPPEIAPHMHAQLIKDFKWIRSGGALESTDASHANFTDSSAANASKAKSGKRKGADSASEDSDESEDDDDEDLELSEELKQKLQSPAERARLEKEKTYFKPIKYVIMIMPCWLEKATPAAVEFKEQQLADAQLCALRLSGASLKQASKLPKPKATVENGYISHFYRFEDELFTQNAKWHFSFPVASRSSEDPSTTDADGKPLNPPQRRRVALVPVSKLNDSVDLANNLLMIAQETTVPM